MSKLSKILRSDAGKILTPIAIGYAKNQSAAVRKYAAVAEPVYAVIQAAKSAPNDVLIDTIYSRTGVTMPLEAPQITPGYKTSEFYGVASTVIGLIAAKMFGWNIGSDELAALITALVGVYSAGRTIIKHAAAKQPETIIVQTAPAATSTPVAGEVAESVALSSADEIKAPSA